MQSSGRTAASHSFAAPTACLDVVENICIARQDWQPWAEPEQDSHAFEGSAWTCFRVLGRNRTNFYTGPVAPGLYGIRIERGRTDIATRLADYARYEAGHHRHVVLSGPPDTDWAEFAATALRTTPAAHIPGRRIPRCSCTRRRGNRGSPSPPAGNSARSHALEARAHRCPESAKETLGSQRTMPST